MGSYFFYTYKSSTTDNFIGRERYRYQFKDHYNDERITEFSAWCLGHTLIISNIFNSSHHKGEKKQRGGGGMQLTNTYISGKTCFFSSS